MRRFARIWLDSKNGGYRLYLNDGLTQNTYDPDRKRSVSLFTYALSGLARAYTTNINDVLCIGLGVGIVPMEFANRGARVDVVEINPAVVPVAARFFGLHTNQLNLTLDDGRHFLNRCRKQYDVVVLDAFLGDSSPSHLLTREAFASVRRVLRPGGTLALMRGAPDADLVFVAHAGLESLDHLADAVDRIPLGRPINIEITRIARTEVPAEITSSTIRTRPATLAPTRWPPSPWSLASLRLYAKGTLRPSRASSTATAAANVMPL